MRALFKYDLLVQDFYDIDGESLHHLVNVIRLRSGEKLLLLNGQGLQIETIVESVSKKSMKLKKLTSQLVKRSFEFDLILGVPKREALELCLKEATELGFRKIHLVKSDYSQIRAPENERLIKLLISAVEQSNAPFIPEIISCSLEKVFWEDYPEIIVFDSQSLSSQTRQTPGLLKKALVVGPEGGFSPDEKAYLQEKSHLKAIHLPTPILRTPTAVAAGMGYMLESLRN